MQNISIKKRNPYADMIRGFAILLVVLGHCIQEGSGLSFRSNESYWSDELYQFIYSFHMPLFLMLSGYFSRTSIQNAKESFHKIKQAKGNISALKSLVPPWLKRSFTLLFPILFWTLADQFRIIFLNFYKGYPNQDFKSWMFSTVFLFASNLWFLWVLWFCYTITLVMHVIFRDSLLLYLLGFLLFFITWDGLWLGNAKFLFPFYLVAFYGNPLWEKWKNFFLKQSAILRMLALTGSGILFGILIYYYNENSFIYLTGYKLLGKNILLQLGIDFFRFIIGFTGCIFFLLLWYFITKKSSYSFPFLCFLGRNSLGIYILSGYAIIFGVQPIADAFTPSYTINLLETFAVVIICSLLSAALSRIPFLRKSIGK